MEINKNTSLIIKCLFGEASESEHARLNAWLEESPLNRELYDKLGSAEFLQRAVADDNRALFKREWARLRRQTFGRNRKLRRRRALRIAAAVAVPFIFLAAFFAYDTLRYRESIPMMALSQIHPGSPRAIVTLADGQQMTFTDESLPVVVSSGTTQMVNESSTLSISSSSKDAETTQYNVISIPRGGEYTVKLEDGTVIFMNSESELRIPVRFAGNERRISFRGEGYFEVARDQRRPFIVETQRACVAVKGTQFNLRAYQNEPETVTTLVEGAVDVISDSDNHVKMIPGTQSRVDERGDVIVRTVDVYPFTAWRSGRIYFENERAEHIMKELERWYNCQITFMDEELKDQRFTMDLMRYDQITTLFDLMNKVKNVKYTVEGRQIKLYL